MIYFIILAVLAFLTLFEYISSDLRGYKNGVLKWNIGRYSIEFKNIIFIFLIIVLIVFSGLRYYSGFDYINYIRIFKRAEEGIRYLNIEYGYYALNRLIGMITGNGQVIIFLMAFLTLSIKAFVIGKKSKNKIFALYIYFCMYFLVYDMGQIRSSFAQAITFLAIYLYMDGKLKTSIILIVLGAFFHTSCLIVLLIFLFRDQWLSEKFLIIGYILSIIIGQLINLKYIGDIAKHFNGSLAHKIYEYTASSTFAVRAGFNFTVLFNTAIFLFILYMRRRYRLNNRSFNILFNSYFISIVIYMLFNNYFVIAVRLSDYLRLSIVLLIPLLINLIENKKIKYFIVFILILILTLMVFRELSVNSASFLPYKINFFNNAKLISIN
ncbi:MAG: EpsG family protein [Sarcina sp.]